MGWRGRGGGGASRLTPVSALRKQSWEPSTGTGLPGVVFVYRAGEIVNKAEVVQSVLRRLDALLWRNVEKSAGATGELRGKVGVAVDSAVDLLEACRDIFGKPEVPDLDAGKNGEVRERGSGGRGGGGGVVEVREKKRNYNKLGTHATPQVRQWWRLSARESLGQTSHRR